MGILKGPSPEESKLDISKVFYILTMKMYLKIHCQLYFSSKLPPIVFKTSKPRAMILTKNVNGAELRLSGSVNETHRIRER